MALLFAVVVLLFTVVVLLFAVVLLLFAVVVLLCDDNRSPSPSIPLRKSRGRMQMPSAAAKSDSPPHGRTYPWDSGSGDASRPVCVDWPGNHAYPSDDSRLKCFKSV